jgi:2-C-methyl-D-erythritol 4-phosphate cytidylyltransferase
VKQYADLGGSALLARTLDRLSVIGCEAMIVVVAPNDDACEHIVARRAGVEILRRGGTTRAETVSNALASIAGRCADDDWVLVHDAARPCVPVDALQRLVDTLRDDPVGGLLAIPVSDTLKRAAAGQPARVARTEDRTMLWHAQTPQMFRYGVLSAALDGADALSCTDEAQAVERLAHAGRCNAPRLVPGSSENIKITFPEDLVLAAAILKSQGQR